MTLLLASLVPHTSHTTHTLHAVGEDQVRYLRLPGGEGVGWCGSYELVSQTVHRIRSEEVLSL